jgi:hypothetical protein
MINPIEKNNLFVTPDSFEELSQALNTIGSPEEQRLAWFGAMMALNLAHDLIEKTFADVALKQHLEPQ